MKCKMLSNQNDIIKTEFLLKNLVTAIQIKSHRSKTAPYPFNLRNRCTNTDICKNTFR